MSLTRTLGSSLLLVMMFVTGLVVGQVQDQDTGGAPTAAPDTTVAASQGSTQTRPTPAIPSAGLPDLSAVAERAIQASVNISSTQQVAVDPYFQLFYGADAVQSQTSLGSGVLVSADGYIVTNSHVVGDPRAEIKVTLSDNRELPGEIVGIDPYTDLAVVKVAVRGAAPLPWGDSSKLRVAEWVIAVGNPFSFNQTVTLGIVSAPNRHDPQLATYNDFIQTDAAINRGNSGGALVSSRGELIGINTMIYSETGGYQGIGFAIPANLAKRIMEELIKDGEVVRGSIGNLTLRTISADQARAARLGDRGGVYVENMYRSDPAYRAGILPRDVIVKFNGRDVTEQSQLRRWIAEMPVNSTVTLEVLRQGKPRTFEVPVTRLAPPRRRF
jgi:S1-C subfamily serine protease